MKTTKIERTNGELVEGVWVQYLGTDTSGLGNSDIDLYRLPSGELIEAAQRSCDCRAVAIERA